MSPYIPKLTTARHQLECEIYQPTAADVHASVTTDMQPPLVEPRGKIVRTANTFAPKQPCVTRHESHAYGYLAAISRLFVFLLCSISLGRPICSFAEENGASNDFFETKIRPLFVAKCHACHGEKKQEAGLRLTSQKATLIGGDKGPALVLGNAAESLLMQAVSYEGELKMPPDGKLSASEIADLNRWIEDGGVWPNDDESHQTPSTAILSTTKEDLWSLKPVREILPPAVKDLSWPISPIDNFILAELEQHGLMPSTPASKRKLLRRVAFDLTGLPPSPTEMHEFLNDESPDAFAKVVERLLASPAYGERWGRHWLDVVRYADARDLIQLPIDSDFREAWRYRDWVVKAFNDDLPYDQFVALQIAGDLIQPEDPAQIDADALVATGMLAIADFVPGDVNKDQMIADYVNDQVDVVGRAILGMTIACARCHDHKFDPISTHDYYALAGIFFSTRLIPGPVLGNTPLVRVPLLSATQIKAIETQAARDKQRLEELSKRVETAADRQYVAAFETRVVSAIVDDLPIAVKYFHDVHQPNRLSPVEFAAAHGTDAETLNRWLIFLYRQPTLSALTELLKESPGSAEQAEKTANASEALVANLVMFANTRQTRLTQDPVAKSVADARMLEFRADDFSISSDAAGEITLWPDRGGFGHDAVAVSETQGPKMATAMIHGALRPVIRFDGGAMLQAPRSVPARGALFAVFRPDANAAGTRLVGWEDSAGGQHGVGLMPTADGGLHAVLRRAGASGDVVAAAGGSSDFQLISLTWGTNGVALFRNGEAVGSNPALDCVSVDPEITALHIGGPGSGVAGRFRGDLCELRVCSTPLDEAARRQIEAELTSRWLAPPQNLAATEQSLPAVVSTPLSELYDELLSPRSPYWLDAAQRAASLPAEVRQQLAAERDELASLKSQKPIEIPRAVVVQDGGPPGTKHEGFQDAAIYIRGNPAKPGMKVPRGFPQALAGANDCRISPAKISAASGRRELAAWLTQANNPLTARVMVNRLWQHHFGVGLVRTSTNFGVRGELPSHPELLDYLASRFMTSGWSVKAMQRLIVLSRVYQQESRTDTLDPENRQLARMPRRRLESEAIRDSLLVVSGLLDRTVGGVGFLEVEIPRRTLYLMSVRTGTKTADFNSLFDGPDGGGIIERRNESIVAPQALFFMNEAWVDHISVALAARIVRESPSSDAAVHVATLYEIVLGRQPTTAEIDLGLQLITETSVGDPWVRYCRLLLCSNEFLYVD